MSTLTPSFRFPAKLPEDSAHPLVRKAVENAANGIVDLNQAIVALKAQITVLQNTSTSSSPSSATSSASTVTTAGVTTFNSATGSITFFPNLGGANDQTGQTAYATVNTDNGSLIVVDDASAVTVTLTTGAVLPFFCFITNLGAGTATLTPSVGTVNGSASFSLPPNYTALCVLQNNTPGMWFVTALPVVPLNTPATAHEWISAYNALTGAFTQSQPAFSDINGKITTSQLPSSGLSVTITTAKLTTGGTNGSMTFSNGILTASTPAT